MPRGAPIGVRRKRNKRDEGYLTPGRLMTLFIVLSMAASVALAAVTVTYKTDSTVNVQTIEGPVRYVAGTETSNRYVTGWTLSSNETYFSVTLLGVPEANLTIDHLFKIQNFDTATHTVTLSIASVVSNANIDELKFVFYDSADDSYVATWDLEGSTSVAFSNMPASKVYYAKVFIELASGAGNDNVDETLSVDLALS